MKNILHILPVSERGGAERIHESWFSYLKDDFSCHVILPKYGMLYETLKSLDIRVVVPENFKIKNLLDSVKFIREYVNNESIDLIHSSMPYSHLFGSLSILLSNHCREVWSNHGPMSSNFYQGFIPLLPSSAVLVHSQYMYELQRKALYNSSQVRLVPYGVNTNIIYPNRMNQNLLKQKYQIPSEAILLGIVGRIDRWKGQEIVLRALSKIKYDRDRIYCFLVGGAIFGVGSDYQSELFKLVDRLKLTENVIFTGHVNNVYDYYDLLDIVIHASLIPEPFGLVVAEAMAKEKAVIATQGGGPSEMIQHGVNGFLYSPGNVEELAQLLSELIENFPHSVVSISQNARASIEQNFSLQKSVNILKKTYFDILKT